MSGGLFVNVQGAKSNPPLLHTRLKQAAFCIARLSTEKQQLIEMCNCLRGQINTARLKGTVTNTLTYTTSKHPFTQNHSISKFFKTPVEHYITARLVT